MTERKEFQPFTVMLGMVLMVALGVGCVMTGVFAIPGVVYIAYGLLFPLIEGWDHIWNAVERFTDWWMEGRR